MTDKLAPQGLVKIDRNFVQAGTAYFKTSHLGDTFRFYAVTVPAKDDPNKEVTFLYYSPLGSKIKSVYLGMLHNTKGEVIRTKNSPQEKDFLPIKVLNWVLSVLWYNKTIPADYVIESEGRCGRCALPLLHGSTDLYDPQCQAELEKPHPAPILLPPPSKKTSSRSRYPRRP
jgi:hypothetical protein